MFRSLLAAAVLVCTSALAQTPPTVPMPSPTARADQLVGVTNFSIEYSSPGVKGRKIWGELVKYDKPWRAGANAATKLTASHDFTFGGTTVKAGTYSVFVTPGKTAWTVMLNSEAGASEQNRDAAKDVAKLTVKPIALPAVRERLAYIFSDTTEDKVNLDLEWERVRIRVPIAVDTKKLATANIDKAVAEAWRPHYVAANFQFEHGEHDKALGNVDKSIAIQSTWRNEWLRAQILQKKGNKTEAIAAATRASNLGAGDPIFEQFCKANIAKAVAGWK
jgi:hypothetical protein